ncbi:hypothetical protein [Streptomyces sp. NPDC018031]|uniref:hypothetical protein n=1 Tax=Streptomyces sp. NPDC018031 TaxID=3365033 RepID=UPI00378DB244
MNRTTRSLVVSGAAVAAIGVPLAACGGGGGGGEEGDDQGAVTAAEMEAWRDEASEAGEDVLGGSPEDAALNLLTDCEGTVDAVAEAVESVPDPPYKGEEWRDLVDAVVDRLRQDDVCQAVEDFDREKLAEIGEQIDRAGSWVADVNRHFPSLDWDPESYLQPQD